MIYKKIKKIFMVKEFKELFHEKFHNTLEKCISSLEDQDS